MRIKWVCKGIKIIAGVYHIIITVPWSMTIPWGMYKNLSTYTKQLGLRNVWSIGFCLLKLVLWPLIQNFTLLWKGELQHYMTKYVTEFVFPVHFPIRQLASLLREGTCWQIFKVSITFLHPLSILYFATHSWGRELCCSWQRLEPTLCKHN